MGVAFPWALLMAFQIYSKGVKPNKMPEPFYFIWGSGAMAICAVLNQYDSRFGTVLAWGILIGAAVANQVSANRGKTSPNVASAGGSA